MHIKESTYNNTSHMPCKHIPLRPLLHCQPVVGTCRFVGESQWPPNT